MDPFLGEIKLLAYSHALTNWLLCDGSIQQAKTYPGLCYLLGNTYGGDGVTTFGLPDLRGRVPMCPTPQYPAYANPGKTGGAETVTLTADNLPSHMHYMCASNASANLANASGTYYAAPEENYPIYSPQGPILAIDPDSVQPFGGGGAHDNMQPTMALAYYIATQGNWPSPGESAGPDGANDATT